MATSMADNSTWVLGDVLPVIRVKAGEIFPEEGVLVAGRGPLIYLTNLFTPGLTQRLRECEKVYYKSFEEAEQDGWRVD